MYIYNIAINVFLILPRLKRIFLYIKLKLYTLVMLSRINYLLLFCKKFKIKFIQSNFLYIKISPYFIFIVKTYVTKTLRYFI